MRRFLPAVTLAALALAAPAQAVVLKTNWAEKQQFSNGKGFVRIYVRRIELTGTTWKAWVGIVNRGGRRVTIDAEQIRQGTGQIPISYYAGPGIWWSTWQRGHSWFPGAGQSITRSARAFRVVPGYPKSLANGKSWFGVFSGDARTLPRDRLLRIGFGLFHLEGDTIETGARTNPVAPRRILISTTHQFRLPRR